MHARVMFGLGFRLKGQVTGVYRHRREHPSQTSPCPSDRMAEEAAQLGTAAALGIVVPSPEPITESDEEAAFCAGLCFRTCRQLG